MIKDKRADSLRTISLPERSPYKMWIKKGKKLVYFLNSSDQGKELFNSDRRALPKVYWHDGVIDIIRGSTILKKKNIIGKKIIFMENQYKFLIDIDEKKDLELANILLKSKKIRF